MRKENGNGPFKFDRVLLLHTYRVAQVTVVTSHMKLSAGLHIYSSDIFLLLFALGLGCNDYEL